MNKYTKLLIYVAIGLIAFTVTSRVIITDNTSYFQGQVIIPNTSVLLGSYGTGYYSFNDTFTIETTAEKSENNDLKTSWQGATAYINLSLYSKNDPIYIYASDDYDNILNTDPILTCSPDVGCGFETDVEYDYYVIKSEGQVDMQVLSGEAKTEN